MELAPEPSRESLYEYVQENFQVAVPRVSVCPGHDAPWEGVYRLFAEERDLVVWACRGGGKSFAAALATTLQAICRDGAEQVVLGGSQEQSDRVAEHVRNLLGHVPHLVHDDSRRRKIRLVNDSTILVLAQSETSVRGIHADRVRCDEVELFDPEVWRALWFCTSGRKVRRGSLDVLSTAHVPGGIMEGLVARCLEGTHPARLLRWCLWEVIERCGPERDCDDCPLAGDCQGRARRAEGFLRIDDAIAIQARSSRSAWEAEMLCRGARRDYLVFAEFDAARHVAPVEFNARFQTYRAIDFGYAHPLACLWVQLTPDGHVHVCDEYVQSRVSLARHAQVIRARYLGPVTATYVDPAGQASSPAGGQTCIEILAGAGIPCTCRGSTIADGLELIRAALAPAEGPPRLLIHPRCQELSQAFRSYHYPAPGSARGASPEAPVKDGPDHLIDALRYFFVNRLRPRIGTTRRDY